MERRDSLVRWFAVAMLATLTACRLDGPIDEPEDPPPAPPEDEFSISSGMDVSFRVAGVGCEGALVSVTNLAFKTRTGGDQGFVLARAPECAGSKVVTVEGARVAEIQSEDVLVTDAAGIAVPAWVSVEAGRVAIVVDDAAAEYPLTIEYFAP